MNLSKIINVAKNLGAKAFREAVPGGGVILDAVNAVLPTPLDKSATAHDVELAISQLEPEQRASLMSKQFDVDLAHINQSNETLRTMLESDAKNPHSTRPKIALMFARVTSFAVIAVVSILCVAVVQNDGEAIQALGESWPFIIGLLGTPTTVLLSYFGTLKHEHKNKLDAANGHKTSAVTGIMSLLTKG